MSEKAVEEKIAALTQLMQNPDWKDWGMLRQRRILYDIFRLTNEGRELSHQTEERLNEISSLFFSAQLLKVLTKLRLEVYGFKFAALNFIDIDDVIDDLSYDNSRLYTIIPHGLLSKLKRELLGQSQNVAVSCTASTCSLPKYQQQPTAGAGGGGADLQYNLPDQIVNPSLFALTVNRPQDNGYPPTRESSFQPTQQPEFGAFPTAPGFSSYPSGTVWDGAPVCLPPGALLPTEEEDFLFDQHICSVHHFVDGEWKEQGGVRVMLLRDPSSKKVQLLMRREKDRKVCAHHTVTSHTNLSEVNALKYSWMWFAMDFADNEKGKLESFVASFETEKQFVEFREVFERFPGTGSLVFTSNSDPKPSTDQATTDSGSFRFSLKPGTGLGGFNFSMNTRTISQTTATYFSKSRGSATTSSVNERDSVPLKSVSRLSAAKPASNGENTFGNVSFRPAPFSAAMVAQGGSLFGNTSFMRPDSTVSRLSFASLASSPATGFNKTASFTLSGAGKPILDGKQFSEISKIHDASAYSHPAFMRPDLTVSGLSFALSASSPATGFKKATSFTWSDAGKTIFDGQQFAKISNIHDAPTDSHAAGYDCGIPFMCPGSTVSGLSFSSLASSSTTGFNKTASFTWSEAGKPIFDEKQFTEISKIHEAPAESHVDGFDRGSPPGKVRERI